jgi:hypothetical protein
MPVKFPKGFGRRKSTVTPFEDGPEEPVVEPSFRVFERPDGRRKSFDGGVKFVKSATAPAHGRPRTTVIESDNMFENVMKNRYVTNLENPAALRLARLFTLTLCVAAVVHQIPTLRRLQTRPD